MNIFLTDINKSIVLQRTSFLIVFLISLFFLFRLEHTALPFTKDGVHFQRWDSDIMMQCLQSKGLRNHPFKSLWYLHKEPPLYDAIRALLISCLQKVPDKFLLLRLDQLIYYMWVIVYSLMVVMIYHWLSQLTSFRFAFYISMAWILHPSPIYFATFLDPSILDSLVVLCLFYELWLFYSKRGSILRLSTSVLILFYLRATCQWYFFILIACCLVLMKIPRKQVMKFIIICTLLIVPYVAKQYYLFKNIGSTYLGYHFYYLVAGDSQPVNEIKILADSIPWTYPKDASLSIGVYNTEKEWRENFAYYKLFNQYLVHHPFEAVKNIATTFVYNWHDYWRPSSVYEGSNVVVRILPWNYRFIQFFSYPSNFLILVFSFFLWRKMRKDAGLPSIDNGILGIGLILFYIFMSSTLINGNGKGATEAVRYKFFLEPIYYVFIAGSFYSLI